MRLANSIAALVIAAFATPSLANPPAGIFSATNPTVSRYPVMLTSTAEGNDVYCGKQADPLALVDASGKIVAYPFIVPAFSKFVLTDVEWSARNSSNTPDALVTTELIAMLIGTVDEKSMLFNADRVTALFASGNRAFAEGQVFVAQTVICVTGRAALANETYQTQPLVEAYGYLVEDAAIPPP